MARTWLRQRSMTLNFACFNRAHLLSFFALVSFHRILNSFWFCAVVLLCGYLNIYADGVVLRTSTKKKKEWKRQNKRREKASALFPLRFYLDREAVFAVSFFFFLVKCPLVGQRKKNQKSFFKSPFALMLFVKEVVFAL